MVTMHKAHNGCYLGLVMAISSILQGQIQDFGKGCLNIEVDL